MRLSYNPPAYALDVHESLPRLPPATETARQRPSRLRADCVDKADAAYETLREIVDRVPPAEMREFSKELVEITVSVEILEDARRFLTPDTAFTAWVLSERLYRYGVENRCSLDKPHRINLWIARLRCIALASCRCLEALPNVQPMHMGGPFDDASSSSSSASATSKPLRQKRVNAFSKYADTRRDRELFNAHGVLWPNDTRDQKLWTWCNEHHLIPVWVKNVDGHIRNCSTDTLWRIFVFFRTNWNSVPYCANLVAFTWRLLERVADLTTHTGDGREFNHPGFSKELEEVPGEFCVNEDFLVETADTFYAIEWRLRQCSHLKWEERSTTNIPATVAARRIDEDAIVRFEEFVTKRVNDAKFKKAIERDIGVLLFDHVLLPGEMELYEEVYPYFDRKTITCISKTRPVEFDRLQRLYIEPPIENVWRDLISVSGEKLRENRLLPIYMLIASRAIQYHFDSTYSNTSFDTYFPSLENIPRVYLEKSGASSALRDCGEGVTLTRGSVRHLIGGALLRTGMKCTDESLVEHPLVVRCAGGHVVVSGQDSRVIFDGDGSFGVAFLVWLREFCADRRLCGTFANGQNCLDVLEQLNPTKDSRDIVRRAREVLRDLNAERAGLTGLNKAVDALAKVVPSFSTDDVLVI